MKAAEKVLTLPSLAGHKGNETFEVWRRVRDSNPRYPSGYAGFQDLSPSPPFNYPQSLRSALSDDGDV
jgi:hypothetical protein